MLGKKIKELRTEHCLSQQQLANVIGVTKSAVSYWESDKADPDILNIKAIAKFFNITIDELMNFDEYDYIFEYKHNNTSLVHKEKTKIK